MQYQIPLSAQAQRFKIDIAGKTYTLRFQYADAADGGWFMDIGDANGADLVTGLPLVSGIDLLGQHKHLDIGVTLWLTSPEPPAYSELGTSSLLIFEADG